MARIIAHRGLHKEHPENSLSAMRAAWAAGHRWCEFDIHLSADGFPIVIHDNTLDRTTTGQGPVREYFLSDIKALRLRMPNGEATDEPPATMDEILAEMPIGGGLLVEIKPLLGRLCFQVVDRVFAARCMVQSFNRADVDLICRTFGNQPLTGLLLESAEDLNTVAGWVNLKHSELSADVMRILRDAGKRVGVWTVDTREEIERMLRLGVDAIITDEPKLARTILDAT
jgi:glycerophosphoryl diester phosphodiesterase